MYLLSPRRRTRCSIIVRPRRRAQRRRWGQRGRGQGLEAIAIKSSSSLPPRAAAAPAAAGTRHNNLVIIVPHRGRCCRHCRGRRCTERLCRLVPAGEVLGFRPRERNRVLDLVERVVSVVLCAYGGGTPQARKRGTLEGRLGGREGKGGEGRVHPFVVRAYRYRMEW